MAKIEAERKNRNLVCLVQIDSNIMYVPNVKFGTSTGRGIEDTIVLDRKFVQRGETLFVKGGENVLSSRKVSASGYVWEKEGKN